MPLCSHRPRRPLDARWLAAITMALAVLVIGVIAAAGHPFGPKRPAGPGLGRELGAFESAARSGDLIFRRGRTLISRAVLSADPDSEFSHVGLVLVVDGAVQVIHARPPEDEDDGTVVSEPLRIFLDTDSASAAALYRPDDPHTAEVAATVARGYATARVPFDSDFDLATPNTMYCTEMVWRAYRRAGLDLTESGPTGKYLMPSQLQKSARVRLVKTIREENDR